MKILYLLTRKPDAAINTIIDVTGKNHTVTVIKLADTEDYGEIIAAIERHDRVISW